VKNLDETTIIVFVRNDLPIAQDDIQSDHACFHLGMVVGEALGSAPGIPFISSKEKLRTSSIEKLERYCIEEGILHYMMHDDDVDKEHATALAILAIEPEHKSFFRKYPLRKYAPIAQLREHPVSNGQVAGENPAGRSNIGESAC
jgi:hypothetical protein